jgi:hypothetical protein
MEKKSLEKPDKIFRNSFIIIHLISFAIIFLFFGQFMIDFKYFISYHDGQQLYLFLFWAFYIFLFELTIFWRFARKFLNVTTPILVLFPAIYIIAQNILNTGIDSLIISIISPFIIIFLLTYSSTKNYISNNISKANEFLLWAILSISITASLFGLIFAMSS